MNNQISKAANQVDAPSDVLAPALFAILLGAFLVLGTGFTQPDAIHNAAHDGRHSLAFPCH
jgi:cobalt transporter subunit CbtB